ncbi:Alpha/Beta hydrolase protein [Tricladium varicosporioides]|nr:Alpha/Beta hydrolase protein [Hymenoscyphus varicosporioides]
MKFHISVLTLFSLVCPILADAITTSQKIPDDLNGSNFTYPFPVHLYRFSSQHGQTLEMAYMDLPPSATSTPNNKTALLLHGRNFCSATWNATALVLAQAGYRVILPDQVGFCKSSKPEKYQFSLQQLAANTLGLLSSLHVENVTVIGHSMGGMLATRFSLMFPQNVSELVLVNPIGLEDWLSLGVPWPSLDTTWTSEKAANYSTIRAYEQSTYYVNTWDPSYDVWVNMLVGIYWGSKREVFTWNQAQAVDMVLTQPVVYEFPLLKPKTLLMVGDKDNTAIGKAWSPPDVQKKLGHYDVLGKQVAGMIPGASLIEFGDLGHAPHIQAPERFHGALLGWLGGS